MVTQINIIIVGFFLALIGLGVIVLIVISPKVSEEVGSLIISSRGGGEFSGAKETGLSSIIQELSTSTDTSQIRELQGKIEQELHSIEELGIDVAQKRQTQTIRTWLDSFSKELHIEDIKKTGVSRQVQFNKKTQNFRLIVVKK